MKNTTTLQSKRSITVLLGVLLYFSSLSAQTMQDTIIANFSLMERIPKEKLYLHLDKPFYGAGEKICGGHIHRFPLRCVPLHGCCSKPLST